MKYALITGASAGIGLAFAEEFAGRGFGLILTARRKEKLESEAERITSEYGVPVEVIPSDLAETSAPDKLYKAIDKQGLKVAALVNNAGFALNQDFCEDIWPDHARELQVMVTALTHLCYLFIPEMLMAGYGRVINVSSLAAFLPPRPGDLYSPIKRYVLEVSQSLHLAYASRGVHVCASCPGFTRTEFHDVMGVRSEVDRVPDLFWQPAADVAKESVDAVEAGKSSIVTGWPNRLVAGSMDFIPDVIKEQIAKQSKALFE